MANEMSILDLPDEELANIDPSTLGTQAEATVEEEIQDPPASQEEADTSVAEETEDENASGESAAKVDEAASQQEADTGGAGEEAESGTEKAEGSEESNPEQKVADSKSKETQPKTEEQSTDYKAVYDRLMAPFKANGRDIQVKNVDDAITLMQMGANYNKKMAALKPNLKLLKLLENNGLLNEERIGFLIDLEKKNPDAINKLIKDSGIDPLELDADKADAYKPTQRVVDDREMELDAVLDELQESPSYTKTLDIVSNHWDGASKQVIANSPQLLKVINSHVQSGIYDLITTEMESERVFGRLQGLSDIEAYRQVGDAIQARGGFAHLAQPGQSQGQQTQSKPVVVPPKPKKDDEEIRRQKKLAAGSTKPTTPSKQAQEFNPLALSDEEFGKLIHSNYL